MYGRFWVIAEAEEAADLLGRIGTYHAAIGEHQHEQQAYSRQLEWFTTYLGPTHEKTLLSRYEYANCFMQEHKEYGLLTSLVSDCSQALGANHPVTLKSRVALAIAEGERGNRTYCIEELSQLTSAFRQAGGPDTHDTLMVENSRLLFLQESGSEGVIAAFRHLAKVATKSLGKEDPDNLRILENLGCSLLKTAPFPPFYIAGQDTAVQWNESIANLEEALSILGDALETRARVHGQYHKLTTWCARNMSAAFWLLAARRPLSGQEWERWRLIFLQYQAWLFCHENVYPIGQDHLRFKAHIAEATQDLVWNYVRRTWPQPPSNVESVFARGKCLAEMLDSVLGVAHRDFAPVIADHLHFLRSGRYKDELSSSFGHRFESWRKRLESVQELNREQRELLKEIVRCQNLIA